MAVCSYCPYRVVIPLECQFIRMSSPVPYVSVCVCLGVDEVVQFQMSAAIAFAASVNAY